MFDDIKNNSQIMNDNSSDKNVSKPVEDIFSETEKNNPTPQLQEILDTNTMPAAYQPTNNMYESGKNKKNVLKLLLLIIFVAIVGIGGYIAYGMYQDSQVKKVLNEPETSSVNNDENSSNTNSDVTIISGNVVDTDNDGLSDQEESTFGTDINLPDTDSDNLFDREEIKIYGTDPLNSDTDGDGYLDGDEVKAGYNPLGPGRLWPENPNPNIEE